MENAVRYNRRGGAVWAATRTEDGAAALRIENTGPELSAQQVARLTEPFERLGRRAEGGGAGLGLSIARSVVEAHGGRLRLRARPGGGLVAEARLPASSPAAAGQPRGRRRLRPAARTSAATRSRRPA
jgi:signal transduction histidine kinase